jgi:hypothetical protein
MVEINPECRRHSSRRRTLKRGRIVFNNRNSTIECVVRNLSSRGALLELANVTGIPEDFELYIDNEAKCRGANTIWRRDGKMGVEFSLSPKARTQVLTETGFRCGVPTCRAILAVDLHPLTQIDEDGAQDASNFLALCPTCHEAYRLGTITAETLHTHKSLLKSLTSAFDSRTVDLLLLLVGLPRDSLIVSGDGVLAFAGLVAASYAEVRRTANDGELRANYAVNATPKGRLVIETWKTATPETVE